MDWTEYRYDALARVITKSQPSSLSSSAMLYTHYAHDGMHTTIRLNDQPTPHGGNCAASSTATLTGQLCVSRTYATNGWLLATTDAHGNTTEVTISSPSLNNDRISTFVFDSKGRFKDQSQLDIDNTSLTIEQVLYRNRYGQPLQVHNLQGIDTYIAYDAMGKEHYRYTENGTWQQTQYQRNTSCYSNAAYSVSITSHGPDQTVCMDALGRTLKEDIVSLGGQVSNTVSLYDIDGRILAQSRPLFSTPGLMTDHHWTKTLYDELDRPLVTRMPDGGQSSFTYSGLNVSYTNAENHQRQDVFNILGEKIAYVDYSIDEGNPTVSMAYDAKGNITEINGALNGDVDRITQVYDAFDHLVSINDPSRGGPWQYEHNTLGEQTCMLDPKGQATKLSYDTWGRLISRHYYTNGNLSTCSGDMVGMNQWMYDNTPNLSSSGQLAQSLSTDQTVDYEFDTLGRVVTTITDIDGDSFTQRHRYDLHNRPLYQYDASGRGVSYGYNADGYHVTTTDLGTLRTYQAIEGLSPWGSIAKARHGSDLITTSTFDNLSRVTSILTSLVDGSNVVQDLHYSYDRLGNLMSRQDLLMADPPFSTPFTETFDYDGLNRLTDVQLIIGSAPSIDTLEVDYDLAGRITSKQGKTYSYDESLVVHGMTSITGGYSAIYDDNGNQTQSGDRIIDYTVFNKPRRIENGQSVVEFDYDANLNRFRRIDAMPGGQVLRETLYIGNLEIITDNPSSATPETTYKRYIGDTAIVTEIDASHRVEYTHKDHLGSLNAVTDVNGNLITQLSFGAFGQRRNHLDWQTPINSNPAEDTTTRGYTSHEHVDSLNLIHLNARTYDSDVGQMMQADSIIPDIDDSQSLNRFAYVLNNPLSYIDPTGNSVGLPRGSIRRFINFVIGNSVDERTGDIASAATAGVQAGSVVNNAGLADFSQVEGRDFIGEFAGSAAEFFTNAQFALQDTGDIVREVSGSEILGAPVTIGAAIVGDVLFGTAALIAEGIAEDSTAMMAMGVFAVTPLGKGVKKASDAIDAAQKQATRQVDSVSRVSDDIATREALTREPRSVGSAENKLGIVSGGLKTLKTSRLKNLGIDAEAFKISELGKTEAGKFNIAVDDAGSVFFTPVKKGASDPIPSFSTLDEITIDFPIKQ